MKWIDSNRFMRRILYTILMCLALNANAQNKFHCSYLSTDRENRTDIRFELPETIKFGALIPIKISIRGKKNSDITMNTAVIKDKPFIVLSDLYRIKTPRASIALFMIDPDVSGLFLSYINMGYTPSAEFFKGNCLNIEEENRL